MSGEIRALPILQRKDVKFMRMKKSRRWLSALLAILMLPTMIPTVAFAADGDTSSDFYKIVHVDAGRKYFSVSGIKSIIDNASTAGFTHLQLAVGNDGLRFLLDDMSITANSTTYTSDAVKAGIQAGNKNYNTSMGYNPDTNELTQAEMDTIISYAKSKNMEIIPLINTPGHMDAILYAANVLTDEDCAYDKSERTIDVTNDTAVEFTKALVQKYIDYFANNGSTIFNMGADEYANDVYSSGAMGFGRLQTKGQYDSFVTYVNDVASMIEKAGMKPMAFNDGIYFNDNASCGTFDKNIIISYWSSGWSGYSVASASFLADKGHPMVNTHGDYYYVVGKTDKYDDNGSDYAKSFDSTVFAGSTISNPVGATFCIWCDYPGRETEEEIVENTAPIIAAFGTALPSNTAEPEQKKIEGAPASMTVNESVTLTVSESAVWETSNADVISLAAATRSVESESVTATAKSTGTATITATTDTAVYTADITVTAADSGNTGGVEVTENKTITVTVGATETATISGANYAGTYTTEDPSIATVEVE